MIDLSKLKAGDTVTVVLDEKEARFLRGGFDLSASPQQITSINPPLSTETDQKSFKFEPSVNIRFTDLSAGASYIICGVTSLEIIPPALQKPTTLSRLQEVRDNYLAGNAWASELLNTLIDAEKEKQ